MSKRVPPSVREVWEWKAKAEEETRNLTSEEVIAYYRDRGKELLNEMGLDLPIVAPSKVQKSWPL